MPVYKTQGKRRPEAPRADELPKGLQAIEQAEASTERREDGTFAPGASTQQSKGGKALKNRTALSHRTGLDTQMAMPGFQPYLKQARAYAKQICSDYAKSFGGGYCGPGPASVISSAALQLAASRFLGDQGAATGDADALLKASRLADASRANLLSAQELVALEAEARPKINPLAALRAAVLGTDDDK